jgi:hypothetical protein
MDTAVFLLYNFRFSGHHFELLSMDISGKNAFNDESKRAVLHA